ncbi:hypothetical protein [Marinicella sp. W31]|uniref:hypothetical protein n=1 Tax=Marinicella sp. W31 TaxID=3023713 RepID=UPI0037562E30
MHQTNKQNAGTKKTRTSNWRSYLFEFLSIFVGITLAFALNNWNEERRDGISEKKILQEIRNGLQLDLHDISVNKSGHTLGIQSIKLFRELIENNPVDQSNIGRMYTVLTRDFNSIMNLTGYESLKSKGLEIIKDDDVRFQVISLYDYYYQIIYKIEEEAIEMQSFHNYFSPINELLHPYMQFDDLGQLQTIQQPIELHESDKKRIYSFLWRIENNRLFKLQRYGLIEEKIQALVKAIDRVLKHSKS